MQAGGQEFDPPRLHSASITRRTNDQRPTRYIYGVRRLPSLIIISILSLNILSPSYFSNAANTKAAASDTKLVLVKTLTGNLSPKSVTSSNTGLISAQNMMYQHSVTIYDSTTLKLIATIPDSVDLSTYGYSKTPGVYRGAPVEGAYSSDGKFLYVTNYAMYGSGYNHEGHDVCSPASHFDPSFLYRINLSTLKIDDIYPVGTVPKGIAVAPDNSYVLVSNWCSYNVSVIKISSNKNVKTIKVGAYPRGIAINADSSRAYIAQMGGRQIQVLNLNDFTMTSIPIGSNPRAIALSPDGKFLYATLNLSGKVVSWNLETNKLGASIQTGKNARSLAISGDGSALYVTNFLSGTVSKIRSSDMTLIQTIKVCKEPIGITYDIPTSRTWVACYEGSIKVFDNK